MSRPLPTVEMMTEAGHKIVVNENEVATYRELGYFLMEEFVIPEAPKK